MAKSDHLHDYHNQVSDTLRVSSLMSGVAWAIGARGGLQFVRCLMPPKPLSENGDCRRKRRENGDSRRIWRQSHFSATVAVFGDKWRQCGQALTPPFLSPCLLLPSNYRHGGSPLPLAIRHFRQCAILGLYLFCLAQYDVDPEQQEVLRQAYTRRPLMYIKRHACT